MLNNKLMIECRYCGSVRVLITYYIVDEARIEGIQGWMDKHFHCSPKVDMDLGGDRCFNLKTEGEVSVAQWKQYRAEVGGSEKQNEKLRAIWELSRGVELGINSPECCLREVEAALREALGFPYDEITIDERGYPIEK